MKVTKNYFILAENAFFGPDKKVTIVNIYDIIYAERLPALHGKLTFASNFTFEKPNKTDKEIEVSFSVKSPSGKEMLNPTEKMKQSINTDLETQNVSIIFNVDGVIVSEYGVYHAELMINSKKEAELKIHVKKHNN